MNAENSPARGCGSHDKPADVLKAEHRAIERVLDALDRLRSAERIDRSLWLKVIDFLRNFADGCHHAKEERELFPRLERARIAREGGPIGCMLDEHDYGRTLVGRMHAVLDAAAAGDAVAASSIRQTAAAYVALLRQHIWKEDNVLFAMADRVLGPDEQRELAEEFERTERAGQNAGRHEHYLRVAEELTRAASGLAPAGSVS